ncbi:MAG TPA: class I adenylate-forming enzyme family protein [Mycobacteriales bacterium]|nr:class I adenylate-forming enzyme family protein [Mycobacteriales bacterium]
MSESEGTKVAREEAADAAGPAFDPETFAASGRPLTMGGFLLEVARRYAGNEALVFDDPLRGGETVRWTYADLERNARDVARALIARGVSRGERVATLMANRPEAVAAYFGAALAGAVIVPLSTFATKPELATLLDAAGPSALLLQTTMGSRSFAADVAALQDEDAAVPALVVALGPEPDRHGIESWESFLADADETDEGVIGATVAVTEPTDTALIMFSSGTTSTPKGVVHHHQAPTLQFWIQSELFGRHEQTRMWTALPIFWTAGMNTAMGATLAAGGTWVMQEGFDAGVALALMAREKVTEPYTLPHQARTLAEHPDWAGTDLSSLRCVFGKAVFAKHPSVTDPDRNWQMPVGWGMSETCAFICAYPSTSSRELMRSSLGVLLPGNQLRVVDPETNQPVPRGEEGELLIKGPTLMQHYLGKTPEQCFDADGWFHTGDVGHVGEDGGVHWSGRRDEVIKTAGTLVSPAEIEVALRAYPPVRLCRVLGVPDERLGQLAVLCVELREGATETAADVQGFLRERIAAYKVPKRVEFFGAGEIPLTASKTKVRDDELRALLDAREKQGK